MPDDEQKFVFHKEEEGEFSWQEIDPLGNTVVLRKDTVERHIENVSHHTQEDIRFRHVILPHAKKVVKNPRFILEDNNYSETQRISYVDLLSLEERPGLTCITVSVETDRTPYEVVTIMPRRNTKEIKGAVIYDANKDR